MPEFDASAVCTGSFAFIGPLLLTFLVLLPPSWPAAPVPACQRGLPTGLIKSPQRFEELFAEIEINGGVIEIEGSADPDNVLPSFRSLFRLLELPALIIGLATKRQMAFYQSN